MNFRAFLLILCLSFTISARAQEPIATVSKNDSGQTLSQLSLEELGRIDVTSASRHAEPIGEAAGAVTVLTADDIRRAGVTTIADALRLVTGMQVSRVNGQTWAVTARGFQTAAGNKLVVLIDGRSVYTPLFSGTFWDQQDIILGDIDRIEVIRGPAGALWGANAVNGAINIITKRAVDTPGALVHLDAGTPLGQAEFRYGGRAGAQADYRVYGKFRYLRPQRFTATGASALDEIRTGQAGFRYDRDNKEGRNSFTLQGDAYRGAGGLSDRGDIDVAGANLLARFIHTQATGGQWQAQVYYDATYRNIPRQYGEHRDTGNVDLQYRFRAFPHHDVTVGGGVDLTRSDTTGNDIFFFVPQTRSSALWNGFAQDDISVVPNKVDVVVGAKGEHNVYSGFEFQPTARVRWRPTQTRMVWAAISRAVRMPTRFDEDLRFTGGTPFVVLRGNETFTSENVISTEVGYRRNAGRLFSYDIAAFVNDYTDLRTLEPTLPTGIPIVLQNNMTARTAGVEANAEIAPRSDWRLHAGYALLSERFRFVNNSRDTTQGANERNDPRHQFWVRSFLDLPKRTEIDAVLRAVSSLPNPAVPGYAEVGSSRVDLQACKLEYSIVSPK